VFRAEYCRYLARCGAVPDQASCLDMNVNITTNSDPNLKAAIEAGKIKYDGGIIGRCYHQIGDLSCDRTDEKARTLGGIACYGGTLGTVETGAQCALDDECKSQMCDVPTCADACCQGTCTGAPLEAPPFAIGAACLTAVDCVSGAYCDSTKVCAALKPTGSTCSSTLECAYGTGCAGTTGTRTCKPLPALGEACPDGTCRDTGTYCNAAKTCAKVGLPGDACTASTDCSVYYSCDATGHCAEGPHEGQSCATVSRCADYGNFCETASKICKAPQPTGATCTSANECESRYCTGSVGTMTCQPEPICI